MTSSGGMLPRLTFGPKCFTNHACEDFVGASKIRSSIAKVEPLNRALLDLDAWITGIRRDQSPTRATAPKLGWDETHELWKANPLADWSDDDCWAYIHERGLPYNALHDRGYASIGDIHSTMPGTGREGRWAGTDRTECGLHVK